MKQPAKKFRSLLRGMLASALVSFTVVSLAAADEPAQPANSVDQELLNDLDNELLDGAGDLKKPPAKRPEDSPPAEADLPLDQPEGEDIGIPSPEEDPLGYIGEEMRRVERMMIKREQQAHAEQVQRQIVENLAKLIEQAEQRKNKQSAGAKSKQQSQQQSQRQQVQQPKQSQSGKPGEQQSNQPASDSTDRMGKNQTVAADPALIKGLLKDAWGHLPDRQREQMLQNSPERFLPQYELMIERYYRRLAEEQRGK